MQRLAATTCLIAFVSLTPAHGQVEAGMPIVVDQNGQLVGALAAGDLGSNGFYVERYAQVAAVVSGYGGMLGIDAAQFPTLGSALFYDSPDCTGVPWVNEDLINDPTPSSYFGEVAFSWQAMEAPAGTKTRNWVGPDSPFAVFQPGSYWLQGGCGPFSNTLGFYQTTLVQAGFGNQFTPPFRIDVAPLQPSTLQALAIPTMNQWGVVVLILLLIWQSGLHIRRMASETKGRRQ